MGLQIRRGTNAERQTIVPLQGELLFTTDTKKLYVGDGTSIGGVSVDTTNGGGEADGNTTYTISAESVLGGANLRLTGSDSTIDEVQLAAGTNVSIVRTDANTITISSTGSGSVSSLDDLTDVAVSLPTPGQVLSYNGSGWTNTTLISPSGIQNLVEDTTPQLGGNLDLNSFDISGTGNVTINGVLSTSEVTFDGDTLIVQNKVLNIGTELETASTTLNFQATNATSPINIRNIAGTIEDTSKISFQGHKGSLTNPQAVVGGEMLGAVSFSLIHPTGGELPAAGIFGYVDADGVQSDLVANGKIEILVDGGTTGFNPKYFVFDSKGRMGVNTQTAQATLDVNGVARLEPQSSEPLSPVAGMIAVANRVNWDPAAVGSGDSYPVFYNGTNWLKMTP
jgi:hypothetical protein